MKIITKPRGGGKTTELIKMSAKTGQYIVCRDPGWVQRFAQELGYTIPFPLTYLEFIRREYSPKIKGFLIDDVEMLLDKLSYPPIVAFSISAQFAEPTENEKPDHPNL